IEENNPDYKVWAQPLWEPPSGEIESLLFCLQAAIGSIIIGFIFGNWYGGKKAKKQQ
ncbi:MAG TPA: energy-coupling factor ABC transporter substrate-binding protein, partial [Methanosphaera sp.]|nr:energy-coupling factor ABC transporter substrate-binding protein [Methanosphaera sp.]